MKLTHVLCSSIVRLELMIVIRYENNNNKHNLKEIRANSQAPSQYDVNLSQILTDLYFGNIYLNGEYRQN